MRARWGWVVPAVLLAAACNRDGRGARPPHDDEPPVAETATEPASEAPAPPAEAPTEPLPPTDPADAIADPPPLSAPTEEEFRAWDRRDPEAEAELDAWDREHLDQSLRTYDELRCFHKTLLAAGERHLGKDSDDAKWTAFKRDWFTMLNEWQMRYFMENPRILESSKFIGPFLEAHELLMRTYVEAYDDRDRSAVEKAGAHWLVVEGKIRKRMEKLGGKLAPAPARCEPPANK